MSLKDKINTNRLPLHIAIIMDGNGRWAKKRGKLRIFGHKSAIEAVRDTIEACAELGIKYVTLYAFSTENWNRPRFEVDALMELLVGTINKEKETLQKNNIRLTAIGNLPALPEKCFRELKQAMEDTAKNKRMTLQLALSYSSKWEIEEAVRKIAKLVADGKMKIEDINEKSISDNLATAGVPDPELMIRTSGELRISNFLLWQLAYTELYFTEKLWPDFRREDLYAAIVEYQDRSRRFGKVQEQMEQ